MLKGNHRTARWLLCCVVASLSTACAITPDWTPRKRAAAECPNDDLQYCMQKNSGTRCGCMPKQEMEAILRSHL
jgi:hypothetical protein